MREGVALNLLRLRLISGRDTQTLQAGREPCAGRTVIFQLRRHPKHENWNSSRDAAGRNTRRRDAQDGQEVRVQGHRVTVQSGAGTAVSYLDDAYATLSGGSDCLHIDCTISCNGVGALPTICIQLRPGRPEIRSCAQPCPRPCRRHGTSISTDHHLDVDLIDAQAPDDRVPVCGETLSPMPSDDKRSARAPLSVAALRVSLPVRARNMLLRLRASQRLLRKTTVPPHARATQRMRR